MVGRSVVITGAAQGIGAACVARFAASGDKLVLADVDESAGRTLTRQLIEQNFEAVFVHADVTNRLHVHNIIAEALEAFGRIDVLAHTILERHSAPFLETSEEDFDRIVTANIRGAFLINQAVSKQMVKQLDQSAATESAGVIVNVGSVEAVTASADQVAFAASQGGLHQLTKAIAMSMSRFGIRANAVGVGAIKGDISSESESETLQNATPLQRLGDPEEVAEVIFFLSSEFASYVTGQCIYVDGGSLARKGSTSSSAIK